MQYEQNVTNIQPKEASNEEDFTRIDNVKQERQALESIRGKVTIPDWNMMDKLGYNGVEVTQDLVYL